MNSVVDQPNWEFRCAFARTYCVVAVGVSLEVLALYYIDLSITGRARPPGLLGLLLTTLLIMVPVVAVAINYLTFMVNSTRVRGYDSWGWYFDLEWDDIAAVRVINLGVLNHLGLRSHSTGREMRVPLYFTEMAHFFLLVSEFTQPDTPLHQFARAWLNAQKVRPVESVPIRYHYY